MEDKKFPQWVIANNDVDIHTSKGFEPVATAMNKSYAKDLVRLPELKEENEQLKEKIKDALGLIARSKTIITQLSSLPIKQDYRDLLNDFITELSAAIK